MTLALLLQILFAAVVLFAVFAFATGWLDPMSGAEPDEVREHLPENPTAGDVEELVLPMAVRGYRMAEVDAALDRLTALIADRERDVADLRAQLAAAQTAEPAEPAEQLAYATVPSGAAEGSPVAEPVDLTKDGASGAPRT